MQPILDRVIVRRIESPNKRESVIETPELYRQQSRWGTVVAVGTGVVLGQKYVPLTEFVKVGDQVYFGEYNAEPFEADGEELVLLRLQDIRFVK